MTFNVIIMFYHIIRTYLTVSTFYLVIMTHHGDIIFQVQFSSFLWKQASVERVGAATT